MHRTMEQLQQEVRAFCARHRLDAPLAHRVLDAMSELGEVAKEVLRMTDYGRRPPEQQRTLYIAASFSRIAPNSAIRRPNCRRSRQ